MVHHKGRGIAFGGVHDVEEDEEGIDSEFFNQLLAFNIDRNRFFQLALRRPRAQKKQAPAAERGRRGRGKADEEELLRNLALIEGKVSLEDGGDGQPIPGVDSDEERVEARPEKPTLWEFPHVRFNAQLAVQDDVLFIYGGTYEKGDREFTFDEMHAIDLGKLDGVKEVFRRELEDWQGSEDEESDEEDEEDDEEASDEEPDPSTPATSVGDDLLTAKPGAPETAAEPEPEPEGEEAEPADTLPHPRPFESLREFFSRTSNQWQDIVLEEMKYRRNQEGRAVKEIRKEAFDRAEQKWWDCREDIQALEDEQEEAGIGEVVSIADRGGAEGGAPRRR
ncbi:Kelch repeat-containing protein 3 [Taxawa tesnikishii (nom. ined.)]|nr:Kelch repeat-containing protein 3 [Dothideales sp. JES 119]